jgi:hypothetical protein
VEDQSFNPVLESGASISSVAEYRLSTCLIIWKDLSVSKILAFFLLIPAAAAAPAVPTFTRDVAPILYRKCTGCHHPDDVAPMSFLDFKSVRPWAKSIKEAVLLKRMPPWFADPHYGPYGNDPTLTDTEKQTLVAWADQGAKEGDARDLPAAPVYTEGWRIGKPDVVFDIGQDHMLKGNPADEYISFTVPTNFSEGHWVQALGIRPGNRKAVHHAHVTVIDASGQRVNGGKAAAKAPSFVDFTFRGEDRLRHLQVEAPVVDDACSYAGPEIAGLRKAGPGALVSYLPGMPPDVYPADSAKWIPAGAQLRFTIHYHWEKSGEGAAATDRTRVGMIFAGAKPQHPMHRMDVDNNFFAIPAGDGNHQVRQCATFESDSLLLSLTAHMHLRGKDARFEIERPGETPQTVLYVPKYDFNWQLKYREKEPVFVPKGTRLIITFHYDNSANNAANPNPRKQIRWGEPSEEEMMSGWIDYIDAPGRARPAESASRPFIPTLSR